MCQRGNSKRKSQFNLVWHTNLSYFIWFLIIRNVPFGNTISSCKYFERMKETEHDISWLNVPNRNYMFSFSVDNLTWDLSPMYSLLLTWAKTNEMIYILPFRTSKKNVCGNWHFFLFFLFSFKYFMGFLRLPRFLSLKRRHRIIIVHNK